MVDSYEYQPDGKIVPTKIQKTCIEVHKIAVSIDFNTYNLSVPECWFNDRSEIDFAKFVVTTKFQKTIIPFRGDPPKWNGEDYVFELCFVYGDGWRYYIKTPLDMVPNIFITPESQYAYEETGNITLLSLRELNLEILKKNEFVSKRSSIYNISTTDVNYLLTKFKKQL